MTREEIIAGPHRWLDGEPVALTAEEIAAANFAQTEWEKGETARQIKVLEAQITPRRLREAGSDDAGGTVEGRAWMLNITQQIAVLRGKLA